MMLGLIVTFAAGCAATSAAPALRTTMEVNRCLRLHHLDAGNVKRGTTFLDTLKPRPRSLISTGEALIAIYRSRPDAASVFSTAKTTFPLLQHANALIISFITPQPSRSQLQRLKICAFGERGHATTGPLIKPGS